MYLSLCDEIKVNHRTLFRHKDSHIKNYARKERKQYTKSDIQVRHSETLISGSTINNKRKHNKTQ
jgi:hypothetical protein